MVSPESPVKYTVVSACTVRNQSPCYTIKGNKQENGFY